MNKTDGLALYGYTECSCNFLPPKILIDMKSTENTDRTKFEDLSEEQQQKIEQDIAEIPDSKHYDASDAQVGPIHYNSMSKKATGQVNLEDNNRIGFAYASDDLDVQGFEAAIEEEE